eukprot:164846-Pelagomonas_calceolata.AAC.5
MHCGLVARHSKPFTPTREGQAVHHCRIGTPAQLLDSPKIGMERKSMSSRRTAGVSGTAAKQQP